MVNMVNKVNKVNKVNALFFSLRDLTEIKR